jgi:hypothetical protein
MHTECLIALITSKTYIHMLIFRIDTLPTIITWYAIFLVNITLDLALVYTRDLLQSYFSHWINIYLINKNDIADWFILINICEVSLVLSYLLLNY